MQNRYFKDTQKKLTIPTVTYVFLFINKLKKKIKKTKYRSHILNQWLTTEYGYLRDLKATVTMIKRPMIEEYKMIDEFQAEQLFSQIDNMISLSSMMIEVLAKAKKKTNPNQVLLGKELKSYAYGYKIYGKYFEVHSKKQDKINELAEKQQNKMKQIEVNLRKEMKKIDSSKESVTIQDLMEEPLYRLFKYVLFMKDYIKRLPTSHPDYQAINEAMKTFHDINTFNNEKMNEIQGQKKQQKLDKLYGGIIKNTRTLVAAEMQADTLYSSGKLYVFNDLAIITKIQKSFGSQREQKYQSIELDEFSFIEEQEDMKYFKNILILIGEEKCIHLLFADEGSRFEVFKCLNKVIRKLRIKADDRRKVDTLQKNRNEHKKKITFTLKTSQIEDTCFRPEYRAQILGIEIRPLSKLTNETIYHTSFMIPTYYEDELIEIQTSFAKSKMKKQFKVRKMNSLPFSQQKYDQGQEFQEAVKKIPHLNINQRIQLHFSQLQNLYNMVATKCGSDLPSIDPLTKQVNIYSKSKKKTKLFEMRNFFIEEFLNYIFRYDALLENPLLYIDKLRINTQFWDYTTERNNSIRYPSQPPKSYGDDHCQICHKSQIQSISTFESHRSYFLGDGAHLTNRVHEKYCFNFFNLLRLRLLEFSYIAFGSLQRILLYYHYSQGRLDYPFLQHVKTKSKEAIKIYLPTIEQQSLIQHFDHQTTVGQIVDEIGIHFKMNMCFDYDLVAIFNGKKRVLDRDEFIIDSVQSLDIKIIDTDKHDQHKQSRGFFGTLKKFKNDILNKEEEPNKIFFMKTIYLHKSLELKSNENISKMELEVQKIYWCIKGGSIKLSDSQFVQLAAYYYTLKQMDNLKNFIVEKMDKKLLSGIVPEEKHYSFENFAEMKRQIGIAIEQQRNIIFERKKDQRYLMAKIINYIWNCKDYYTFYVEAKPRLMPPSVCKVMPDHCLIGVNYKQIIITKSLKDTAPIIHMEIVDIQFYKTVFSIFMNHHDMGEFRFDVEMPYQFAEIMNKYQTIWKRFPQHRA